MTKLLTNEPKKRTAREVRRGLRVELSCREEKGREAPKEESSSEEATEDDITCCSNKRLSVGKEKTLWGERTSENAAGRSKRVTKPQVQDTQQENVLIW